jgi:uncharacterized membrane protein
VVAAVIAMLPVTELRGAIPVAAALGIPLKKAFLISVTANIIIVPPLLFFLEPVTQLLRRFRLFARFFDWFFERTKKKASLVEKFEVLGLMLFVAVPLPGTGAWTGAVVASLFKIRFGYAVLAISAGVIIAGVIITALVAFGKILV